MLYKLCKCGKKIPYSQTYCDDCIKDIKLNNKFNNKYYDKSVRKNIYNKKFNDFYHCKEWIRLREVAVVRDHALCQDCLTNDIITSYHVVHHIVSIKEDYNKRLILNNLICLCESCHQVRHSKGQGVSGNF